MNSKNFQVMRYFIILLTPFFFTNCSETVEKQRFYTKDNKVSIRVNNEIITKNWNLSPDIVFDTFKAECRLDVNTVTFFDTTDSISFKIKTNDTIDFDIVINQKDTAITRIIGVIPNVNFSEQYIEKNTGRTNIEIPEVSELANILIALHKDAEIDKNMVDSDTEYYKKVKEYFKPYLNHPIIDTIQKYIKDPAYKEELGHPMFSGDSYWYHYALKMNACAYLFDNNNTIVNNGLIRVIAGSGWFRFDPMKDVELMTDFAIKSDFRKFYQENKPYYESLLTTYNKLNPISKMQQWLDKAFGFSYGNYTIYFSPLVSGAHSTQQFKQGDFNQTLMFICRAEYNEQYSEIMNQLIESRIVFTEIDHNYVNPVSDRHIDIINTIFKNRAIWVEGEVSSLYESPYKIFNEYMTWGMYSLYILDNYPENHLFEYLPLMETQMKNSRGFRLFPEFNRELLRSYQENKTMNIDELYEHMFKWSEAQVQ